MKNSIFPIFALTIFILFFSCEKEPKPEKKKPIDLSGIWKGEGYKCLPGKLYTEEISISHNLKTGEVIATKITGDECVTAGNVTFKGNYNGEDKRFSVTFTVGNPTSPNSSTLSSTIDVLNSKLIKGTSDGVTFKRDFYSDLPDCPCNYFDPKVQQEKKSEKGTWQNCGEASSTFHYGATFEARWVPDDEGEPGQQCTYDQSGNLITGGIAAGSPDIVSPGECGYGTAINDFFANHFCWNSHCENDVIPWVEIPCIQYLKGWPANAGNCGNSHTNIVTGIGHLSQVVGNMNCGDVTDLFKIIDQSNLASPALRTYFHGGAKPDNLLTEMKDLKQLLDCSNFNCAALDMAIKNLQ